MKKLLLSFAFVLFLVPSVSSAAGLSQNQADAIIGLLRAFNVSEQIILQVEGYIEPKSGAPTPPLQIVITPSPVQQPTQPAPVTPPSITVQPVFGNTQPAVTLTGTKCCYSNQLLTPSVPADANGDLSEQEIGAFTLSVNNSSAQRVTSIGINIPDSLVPYLDGLRLVGNNFGATTNSVSSSVVFTNMPYASMTAGIAQVGVFAIVKAMPADTTVSGTLSVVAQNTCVTDSNNIMTCMTQDVPLQTMSLIDHRDDN